MLFAVLLLLHLILFSQLQPTVNTLRSTEDDGTTANPFLPTVSMLNKLNTAHRKKEKKEKKN
jgi:hypothetical protein